MVIFIMVIFILVIFIFIFIFNFIFIFMTEPRALLRARPPLISPLGAAVKIKIKTKKKEEGIKEIHLGSGGEENRSSTSWAPLG